jgi:predicted aconitase with swiveling domain
MDKSKQVVLSSQLKWVERIASIMDDKFSIPGTNFRFGLDPILNLIPLAGDVSGFVVSAILLYIMAKNGVSRKVLILMAVNISVDAVVGAIPLLGQVSDFYIKANTRNIKLLKEHYHQGKHTGSGNGIIAILLIVLFILMSAIIYISYLTLHWLFT